MDVLCVGQLVTDIIVKPVEQVDFSVDTKRVGHISMKNGGDCMNAAIDLALLGNNVGFAGVVGNDNFGDFLLKTVKDHGIDTRGLKAVPEISTSAVIVLVNEKGERTFLYYGGSNDLFSYDYLDISLIEECKIVHVGGTYQLPGFDGDGAAKLFRLAQTKQKLTCMDVTWDTSGRWLEVIKPCLKYLDFFMPSYNEAKEISEKGNPEDMADFFIDEGVKCAIIKLGSNGIYCKSVNGDSFYQPSYKVNVVDTTGAGDSFVAGFLTGLVKNWDLRACAKFASAVSAHCIQKLGATTGIPGFKDIMKFIEVNG